MARHRNIRNAKSYDYEFDEDDCYGHSYEEDYGISPGTLAQYSYSHSKQRGNDFSSFIPSESTVEEGDEVACEGAVRDEVDSVFVKSLDEGDPVLLQACLEMIHDVVGEGYTDEEMKKAAIKSNYNVEEALNSLLSSPKHNEPAVMSFTVAMPSNNMSAAPLEQRQRKNRRNDVQIMENSQKISQKSGPGITKVNMASASKTGFMTTGSKSGFVVYDGTKRRAFSTSPQAQKKLKNGLNNIDSGMQSLQLKSENGYKKSTLPKPQFSSDNLFVEKSENVSVTPKQNKDQKQSETNGDNVKKSKKMLEMVSKYEERQRTSKPLISMVVIGHVDAGKSTLMGHLLYQSGEVSKRAMHKYEQESKKLGKASFAYAWVLDETGEERARGVTMDVGLTKFETENRVVTLMDAPGHRDFIPNMITGASQADVAVLVINATTGEFEAGFDLGGQTREHSLLVRSLGISQLAVAVNKLDTVDWSQKRFDDIVSKLRMFLKQAGFKDSDVVYIPVSGLLGENLIKPATDHRLTSWYKGTYLADVIDRFKPPTRPVDYPLRFCVTDVVRGQGTGINVSGKVETGGIQVGDKIVVLPAGEQCLIKGVEFHDGVKVDFVLAGDHATVTCHGIDIMKIQTGSVLSEIKNPIPVVSQFRARIIIFNISLPITRGFPVELHYKATSEPAVIKRLMSVLNKSTGEVITKKPKVVLKGQNAMVQLMVHRPICIEEYSKVKEMGRFTLRYGGSTIAAGVVTEVLS